MKIGEAALLLSLLAIACGPSAPAPHAATHPVTQPPAERSANQMSAAEAALGQHDYDRALQLAREAEHIRIATLGPAHLDTARATWLVGRVSIAQRRFREALASLSAAEPVVTASAEASAEEKLALLSDVLFALRWTGECDQSALIAEKALAIEEAAHGAGAGAIRWLVASANAHRCVCRFPQALAAAKRAVTLAEQAGQPDSLGEATASVAAIYTAQGDDAFAIPWLERAITAYESATKPQVSLITALQNWGDRSLSVGRIAEARLAVERVERAAGTACGSDASCARDATWWRARMLASTDDPAAAKAALDRAGLALFQWTAERGDPPVPVNPFDHGSHRIVPLPRPCVASKPSSASPVTDAARVVATMRSSFRSCYTDALRVDRTLAVTVRLMARIGADGAVVSAEAIHEARLQPLVVCLIQTLVRKQFSRPEGGSATIVVPVTLMQSSAPAASQ